ncbi:MAG: hypothetical protein DRR08_00785 [Candidatus Parabeggiatoa sp. nov. 2]|nr:MAG: hypothetical protein B6247_05060 [Beggiatoa sp. 4572_84]RKZ64461.1 MAG: hypothetical protein DRR08_00785 [Gammaproteobacteria bacterium]
MYNQLVSLLSASIRFILETILNQWYRFFYTDYHLPITIYRLPIISKIAKSLLQTILFSTSFFVV